MSSKARRNHNQPVQDVSPALLLEAVQLASSQDPQSFTQGSDRLQAMSEMSGFHDGLHEIAAHRALPLPVRQMAALQFKNLVLSNWRARRTLPDEQRTRIRSRCLSFMEEPDDIIANCNEIATAKIARQDYPKEWPTLLSDLVQIVDTHMQQRVDNSSNTPHNFLYLRRALSVLNLVLKDLASVKMPSGQKTMAEVVQALHSKFLGYYTMTAQKIVPENIQSQSFLSTPVFEEIALCLLLHKIVAKLATWTWGRLDRGSPSESEVANHIAWISQFFQTSSIHLKILMELRVTMLQSLGDSPMPSPVLHRTMRLIHFIGKFFLKLQRLSRQRFASLPMCAEVIRYYWAQVENATASPENLTQDSVDAIFPVRTLVQGMQLFKDNLSQWAPSLKGSPNPNALPREFVESAVTSLITRFMRFSQREMAYWSEDPEAWFLKEEEENEMWEYEIRACSERVLMVLCNHFPDYCSPVIIAAFQQAYERKSQDWDFALQKEALYCAIGRCCIPLAGKVPFQQWIDEHVHLEAMQLSPQGDAPIPSHLLIRRRIAWLIARLMTNSCISPNVSRTWETLVFLLTDPNSDLAVRLTTFSSIGECAGGIGFESLILSPYLNPVISQAIQLLSECDIVHVKKRVSTSLSTILEECRDKVAPHLSIITAPLPQLWTEAGEQWELKIALLQVLKTLVESVGPATTFLSGLLVPLIQDCLTPQSIIQLDEDALKLWAAALRNCTTIRSSESSPTFFDLFPKILEMLETNMDLLGWIVSIIESYFLLDPTMLLESYSNVIFSKFISALSESAGLANKKDMIDALALLVQITPSKLWGEAMHTSGLFKHLLLSLAEGEREAILLTHYIYMFSRIILADRSMFCQLMTATAQAQGVAEDELYGGLMNQWWQRFDNMSEPRNRKLTAMGVAVLVSTCQPVILNKLSTEIFNIWLDVFGEIQEAASGEDEGSLDTISPLNLRRLWELDEPHPSWYAGSEGTVEFDRRKQVYDQDPIRTVKLTTFISQHLQEMERVCPPPGLQGYLADADPLVLEQVQTALKE